ncbi:tigger transposable element-derived protein 4-like [Achroia grisella]|uniref:tigger transposable element-derived protein 4-like n=1 Tax=Achroia grisella TaxID=688607 RepID=UPI0027D1FB9A|nr:tigger transposable element-derived protein 4-like [Achroia grisella]
MSLWNLRIADNSSQFLPDFPRKSYTKIDPMGKLHVIYALDNGQSKADIAREYGVHPQTIAYIYKQKESLIKKYRQKYNLLKEVYCVNMDQTLMEWLKDQVKNGQFVNEQELREKAQEIASTLTEDFNCIDDWLSDFRVRHNISKFSSDIECSLQVKEQWIDFINDLDVKDLYIGGITALSHDLDFESYINSQDIDNYVSIMCIVNCLGSEKKELAVIGKEMLNEEFNIRSLPVNYYYDEKAQMNYTAINNYLKQWDETLTCKGKSVLLALDVPGNIIQKDYFTSIRIIDSNSNIFIRKALDKLVECFKFNYRRLQITKKVTYGNVCSQLSLLDCIQMMSMAWFCVSNKYIHQLFFPPQDGSLYFNRNDDYSNGNHSLSQWCKLFNIPINFELYSDLLDKYISCDKSLKCLNLLQSNDSTQSVTELLSQNKPQSASGIEAYQAMKRLVSYLQGESANPSEMASAKYLESHTEFGALFDIHQFIASTNESESVNE